MSKQYDHIHKYRKVLWGKQKTIVWRCMLPGCSHYVHDEMVRNRKSLCSLCNAPFVMNPDKMRRIKPRCDRCQHRKNPVISQLDSLLENL